MSDVLNIALYDDITPAVAREISAALLVDPTADVVLRINSPGGNVTDGYAIANALRSHPGKKTAVVEGLCASAATFPACACDEIHMHAESFFMIHGPWGEVSGSPADMGSQANLLGDMTDLCTALYQRKSGASEEQIREWLSRDTWMTPEKAKAAGFCDLIISDEPPPSARANAQRYMARLRPLKNTIKGNSKMPTFPENLAKKLAKYGLGDEMSPEMLQRAVSAYMEDTDDGPEARREMARAMKAMGDEMDPMASVEKVEGDQEIGERKDNPIVTQKAAEGDDEEKSSSDMGAKMQAKLLKDAGLNPAVQKLIDALTSSQQKTGKRVAELEAEKKAREIKDFHAAAAKHVSKADADEYLALCKGDTATAMALVKKHPEKTAMQRITQGGKPLGTSFASATETDAAPVVNGGRHQLHGYALAKAAKASQSQFAGTGKQPEFERLRAAQIAAARNRPDLFA